MSFISGDFRPSTPGNVRNLLTKYDLPPLQQRREHGCVLQLNDPFQSVKWWRGWYRQCHPKTPDACKWLNASEAAKTATTTQQTLSTASSRYNDKRFTVPTCKNNNNNNNNKIEKLSSNSLELSRQHSCRVNSKSGDSLKLRHCQP